MGRGGGRREGKRGDGSEPAGRERGREYLFVDDEGSFLLDMPFK